MHAENVGVGGILGMSIFLDGILHLIELIRTN